jgi:hypothetical protein
MKTSLNIIGSLLVLAGLIWFLQSINLLPGSFMTGRPEWAVYGAVSAIIGVVLLWLANRKKKGL